MNEPRFRPRVVRPRRGAPAPDFAAFQDTPTAEAAQRAALEQARLNAGVPASPTPPIQLEAVRMPRLAVPRQATQRPFEGQPFVQLPAEIIGNQRTPANLAAQASISTQIPSDATADELRAMGLDEQSVARYASDIHTPPGARVAPSAADAVRHLSAMTPALPDGLSHSSRAPQAVRGPMGIPSMPTPEPTSADVDRNYAVRDGALIPRAQPTSIPEGYAVTSDGQVLPRAEPIPASFMPTEVASAPRDGGMSQYAPGLVAGAPQFEHDIVAGPVQMETAGTVEMGAPRNIRSLAPRVGVPRRQTAPYVAGLPNAPGGTAEMPSALAPNGVDALMNGSGMRTPQRSPLDTQRDTLALNVQYAQQRAQDAQAAGEGIADVEIARQRRLEQNENDRRMAEGRARQAVQRAADRAAAIRIDPSRAMQGASGIANVIAVVLGGIGSGVSGGPNQALAMVQQNIERDLAAQRTDLDTARNAVGDQQNILANVRQEFQSRDAADNAYRENALRQAAAQVEIQAQRTNGAEAGDRAGNLREQLSNAADEARAAAERAEMEFLLSAGNTEAQIRLRNAQAGYQEAQAGSLQQQMARRAAAAMRGRAPYGSWEEWTRLTPAQQATRMENAQNAQLTGTPTADALALSGVPQGGLQGERAPVENGARMAPPGAGGRVDSIELGRQLTNANTLIAGGMPAQEANVRSGLPPGTIQRMALPAELAARANVVDANLRELEDVVAAGGDVPGFGIFDGRLPDFATPEGARLRRSADSLADAHQRMMSGAGGAVQEVQFYRDLLRGDGTEEGLRIGLETMRREMNSVLGNTAGIGSNVQAQDNVAAQLGIAPRAETPVPTTSEPARQRVPLIRARSSGSGRNLE